MSRKEIRKAIARAAKRLDLPYQHVKTHATLRIVAVATWKAKRK